MPTTIELLQQGWRLHQAGHVDTALQYYREALANSPKNADALVYLGIAMFDKRQFAESVQAYREAIEIRKIFPVAWNNMGNSLRMLGEVDEAEKCFETALRQKPGYLLAIKNRGTLWIWTGEIERGLRWYEQGLEAEPDNAELHRNLGVINLLKGNYDVGWDEYRWRWRMPDLTRPRILAAHWQGQPLQGKSILLYPEQGLGDAIHFVRVAQAVKQLGATVMLQCSPPMVPLFTSAPGVDQLFWDTAPPPKVDFHASLIEVVDVLYRLHGEIAWCGDLFSTDRGYLTVSEDLIQWWGQWLQPHSEKRTIGINWQGNPEHHADVYRSVPLDLLEPLTHVPNLQLVNLQFGFGSEQLDSCEFGDAILRLPEHVDSEGGAFTDTAAILKNLDGVVTTDTAVAHLAGAVGANVILMLGRVPDWRWLLDSETTQWYPTMKLVRQKTLGQWEEVVEKVQKLLSS